MAKTLCAVGMAVLVAAPQAAAAVPPVDSAPPTTGGAMIVWCLTHLNRCFRSPPGPVPPPAAVPVAPPAPPPPPYIPPPASPPPPSYEARQLEVFFPAEQSALTPEGRAVVSEVAAYVQQTRASQVRLVGHADAIEPDPDALSLARAKAVADELVSLGVRAAIIAVDGKGTSQPAQPEAPGVPEPLNRRVSILAD